MIMSQIHMITLRFIFRYFAIKLNKSHFDKLHSFTQDLDFFQAPGMIDICNHKNTMKQIKLKYFKK